MAPRSTPHSSQSAVPCVPQGAQSYQELCAANSNARPLPHRTFDIPTAAVDQDSDPGASESNPPANYRGGHYPPAHELSSTLSFSSSPSFISTYEHHAAQNLDLEALQAAIDLAIQSQHDMGGPATQGNLTNNQLRNTTTSAPSSQSFTPVPTDLDLLTQDYPNLGYLTRLACYLHISTTLSVSGWEEPVVQGSLLTGMALSALETARLLHVDAASWRTEDQGEFSTSTSARESY
jgi:hypothetical protein